MTFFIKNNSSSLLSNISQSYLLSNITSLHADELDDDHRHERFGIVQFVYIIALVIFVTAGSYVTIALVTFEYQLDRKKRGRNNKNSVSSAFVTSYVRRGGSGRGVKAWLKAEDSCTLALKMRLCSICAAVCAVLLYLLQLGFELLHAFTDGVHYCLIKSDIMFLLLTYSTSFISLLLWIRQRSMYAHHCRRQFMNNFRQLSNYSAIFLIVFNFIVVPPVFSLTRRYPQWLLSVTTADLGCHTPLDLWIHQVFITVIISNSFTLHSILLYLFVAPLNDHNKNQQQQQQPNSRRPHLKKIIQHACIVSVSDLLLDVAIFLTNYLVANKEEWKQAIVDDLIIMCGVIIALFTFINWRKRLFPFCVSNTTKPSSKNKKYRSAVEGKTNGNLVRFQRAVIGRIGIIDAKERKGGCLKIKEKLSNKKLGCDVTMKNSRSRTSLKENIESIVSETDKKSQQSTNL